jgi:hypothetical protein
MFASFPSIDQYRHFLKEAIHHAQYAGKDAQGKAFYDTSRKD